MSWVSWRGLRSGMTCVLSPDLGEAAQKVLGGAGVHGGTKVNFNVLSWMSEVLNKCWMFRATSENVHKCMIHRWDIKNMRKWAISPEVRTAVFSAAGVTWQPHHLMQPVDFGHQRRWIRGTSSSALSLCTESHNGQPGLSHLAMTLQHLVGTSKPGSQEESLCDSTLHWQQD